jgi:hypothetical protein
VTLARVGEAQALIAEDWAEIRRLRRSEGGADFVTDLLIQGHGGGSVSGAWSGTGLRRMR